MKISISYWSLLSERLIFKQMYHNVTRGSFFYFNVLFFKDIGFWLFIPFWKDHPNIRLKQRWILNSGLGFIWLVSRRSNSTASTPVAHLKVLISWDIRMVWNICWYKCGLLICLPLLVMQMSLFCPNAIEDDKERLRCSCSNPGGYARCVWGWEGNEEMNV